MTFDLIVAYVKFLFLTGTGMLYVLLAAGIGASLFTGDNLYFFVAVVGYFNFIANLENPSIIVMSKEEFDKQEEENANL